MNTDGFEWLFSLWALIIIGLCGMVSHFLKRKVNGETIVDIRNYFNNHFKSTLLATFVTILSVIVFYFKMSSGTPVDILFVGSLGYNFDSIFNKWDGNEKDNIK